MEKEPRRSSILKSQKQRSPFAVIESNDPVADTTLGKQSRRVSFASSNSVKPFVTDPDKNTIWDETYEEVVQTTDSTQSNGSNYTCSTEKENFIPSYSNMELTHNIEIATTEYTNRRTTINFNSVGGENMVIDEDIDNVTNTACSAAQVCGQTILLDDDMEFTAALPHISIHKNFQIPCNKQLPVDKDCRPKQSILTMIRNKHEVVSNSTATQESLSMTRSHPDNMELTQVVPTACNIETNLLLGQTFVRSSSSAVQCFDSNMQIREDSYVHHTVNTMVEDMELTSSIAQNDEKVQGYSTNVTNRENVGIDVNYVNTISKECDIELTSTLHVNKQGFCKGTENKKNIKSTDLEESEKSNILGLTELVQEKSLTKIPQATTCVETSKDLTNLSFVQPTSITAENMEVEGTSVQQSSLITHGFQKSCLTIEQNEKKLPETKHSVPHVQTPDVEESHSHGEISIKMNEVDEGYRRVCAPSFEEKPSRSEFSRIIEGDYNPPVNSKLIALCDSISNFLDPSKHSSFCGVTPVKGATSKDGCVDSFATTPGEACLKIDDEECSLVSGGEASPLHSPTFEPIISSPPLTYTTECEIEYDLEAIMKEPTQWKRNVVNVLSEIDTTLVKLTKLPTSLKNYVEGFDEINRKFDKMLRELDPKLFYSLKDVPMTDDRDDMTESDFSSPAMKSTDEAGGSISNSSQEEDKCFKEKIEERSARCKSFWVIKNVEHGRYQFATMYGRLCFTVDFNEESGVVTKLETFADIDDKMMPIAKYVLNLFEKQLAVKVLPSFLGENYDILSLLDYVEMTMQKMLDILTEHDKLASSCCLEMDENSKFTFKIVDFELMQVWIIEVNYSEVNITEDCIEVHAVVGNVNVRKVKQCVAGCPNGFSFFRSFIENVRAYMKSYKKPLKK